MVVCAKAHKGKVLTIYVFARPMQANAILSPKERKKGVVGKSAEVISVAALGV